MHIYIYIYIYIEILLYILYNIFIRRITAYVVANNFSLRSRTNRNYFDLTYVPVLKTSSRLIE